MNFQKSEGSFRVPRIFLPKRDCKSGLISTILALLGFYRIQCAQNFLIALRIPPLGPPNSEKGCYFINWPSIGQFMANMQRPQIKDFLDVNKSP